MYKNKYDKLYIFEKSLSWRIQIGKNNCKIFKNLICIQGKLLGRFARPSSI